MKKYARTLLRNAVFLKVSTGVLQFMLLLSLFITVPLLLMYAFLLVVYPVLSIIQGVALSEIWETLSTAFVTLGLYPVIYFGFSGGILLGVRYLKKHLHNVMDAHYRAHIRLGYTNQARGVV